jgi:hypothetical protein
MTAFLAANWIWIVLVGSMVFMHLGHRHAGHGGHGGGCGGGTQQPGEEPEPTSHGAHPERRADPLAKMPGPGSDRGHIG